MDDLNKASLLYHAEPQPGKLATHITKSTQSQQDLVLAYSPGVAAPVREIARDTDAAYTYTNKGNLVAVVSNGTAVLGLGNVGAIAGKPVMEGKGVLFKRFADVDVYDIEVDTQDTEEFIQVVSKIGITFGGINLEDIKAPECFVIEEKLQALLDIPVFHDDQHGTAIIVAAGLLNALELQGKNIETAKIVCLGAGAAGIASMHLLLKLGAQADNIFMLDRKGVIHSKRDDLNEYKKSFAIQTEKRSLTDACQDADVFIGLSGPDLLTPDMLKSMADNPIIFALSNPDPEINPELARQTRKDIIMATGRSDYPNQVNNVLGFPFIFKGALAVRAKAINSAMHIAAVHALRDLSREIVPKDVLQVYNMQSLTFGKEYILPTPFDKRLLSYVSGAVAQAAIDSKVARIDIIPDYLRGSPYVKS